MNIGGTYFEPLHEKISKLSRAISRTMDFLGFTSVRLLMQFLARVRSSRLFKGLELRINVDEGLIHKVMLWHKVALLVSFLCIALITYTFK